MTAAAQAARNLENLTMSDPLLAAYLATRPDGYPTPSERQSAEQLFGAAFQKAEAEGGFLTGYFEPELLGAARRQDPFIYPLYRKPPDLTPDTPYHDRRAINEGALVGKGLELLWLADPVEAFFLHIQGSGRVRLSDGRVLRVGFAGKNGRPYRSIGRVLVDRGVFELDDVTADALKDWLNAHPDDAQRVMNENPSYVFFDIRTGLAENEGPIGSAGAPLTPMVSVAADPDHHPLGSVLYVEYDPATGLQDGFAIVQDTGGAIKGQGRLDLFVGSGDSAGKIAGDLKHPIRVTTLSPIKAG